MKSLRIFALILGLGAFSLSALPANAQQEVDPDHFDQSMSAPAQGHPKTAAQKHHSNAKLASKHAHKSHYHRASA